MINLAVINLKVLIKKIMKIIIAILVLAMIIKFVKVVYNNTKKIDFENMKFISKIEIIKNNISISKCYDSNTKKNDNELKKILVAQLAVFAGAEEEIMEKENQEEVLVFESTNETFKETIPENEILKVDENHKTIIADVPQTEKLQTNVIQTNNKKDVYTDIYKTVQIKNESSYTLTEDMVTPNVNYKNNKDIIIYHTHTCESYTPTENSNYLSTGNYRTTDTNYSVVRVGEELTNNLAGKGYTMIHDKTIHDYPAYTGSYTRSLSTVKNLLSVYNTVDAVFDIHRDALRK